LQFSFFAGRITSNGTVSHRQDQLDRVRFDENAVSADWRFDARARLIMGDTPHHAAVASEDSSSLT
jgi:hypothetical protein